MSNKHYLDDDGANVPALLEKAWSVNAFLASERDRYRNFYLNVRCLLAGGETTCTEVTDLLDRLRQLKVEKGDVSAEA